MSSDGTSLLVFSANQSGAWDLSDFSDADHNIAFGYSDAIHRGDGATNRLAIVMRGDQFLCYINGAFIGIYTDNQARPTGPIGLYFPVGGQFSNLVVYPLPTDSPPLWGS